MSIDKVRPGQIYEAADPLDEVPPGLVEKAREAKCSRCKATVVDESSIAGIIMVNYYLPSIGSKVRLVLCGACGFGFREYLQPELADDPLYRALQTRLREMWG